MPAEHVVDDRLHRPRRQRGQADFGQRQQPRSRRRAPDRAAGTRAPRRTRTCRHAPWRGLIPLLGPAESGDGSASAGPGRSSMGIMPAASTTWASARSNTAAARVVCQAVRATMIASATIAEGAARAPVHRHQRDAARGRAPAPRSAACTVPRSSARRRERDAQQAPALRVLLDQRAHVQPAPAADRDAEVAIGPPAVVHLHRRRRAAPRAARRPSRSADACASTQRLAPERALGRCRRATSAGRRGRRRRASGTGAFHGRRVMCSAPRRPAASTTCRAMRPYIRATGLNQVQPGDQRAVEQPALRPAIAARCRAARAGPTRSANWMQRTMVGRRRPPRPSSSSASSGVASAAPSTPGHDERQRQPASTPASAAGTRTDATSVR